MSLKVAGLKFAILPAAWDMLPTNITENLAQARESTETSTEAVRNQPS